MTSEWIVGKQEVIRFLPGCPSSARRTSWRWNILGPKDASINAAELGIMRRGYQSA
jgi:hypothetical protein